MKKALSLLLCFIILFFAFSLALPSAANAYEAEEIAEGQKLYDAFIASLSGFGSGENGQLILDFFDGRVDEFCEYYEKATFKPSDSYRTLPIIDRYVWYVTYTGAVHDTNLDLGDMAYSEYEYNSTTEFFVKNPFFWRGENEVNYFGDSAVQAYKNLAAWQGDFYLKYHDIYNFIEKKSFLDYALENDSGYKKDASVSAYKDYGEYLKSELETIPDRYIVHQSYDNRVEAVAKRSKEYSEIWTRATGRPAADYLNMSDKEQFYAYITYLGLYEELEGVKDYSASFDYWYTYTCFRCRMYSDLYTDEFQAKYEELMRFQHEYYMTNHELYDFGFIRQSTDEEISSASSGSSKQESKVIEEESSAEVSSEGKSSAEVSSEGKSSAEVSSEAESFAEVSSWGDYDSASIAAAGERDKPKKNILAEIEDPMKAAEIVIWSIIGVLLFGICVVLIIAKYSAKNINN